MNQPLVSTPGMTVGILEPAPCLGQVNQAICRAIDMARSEHPDYTHPINAVLIATRPHPKIEIHAFTGQRQVVAHVSGIQADSETEIVGRQVYQKATALIEKILG